MGKTLPTDVLKATNMYNTREKSVIKTNNATIEEDN